MVLVAHRLLLFSFLVLSGFNWALSFESLARVGNIELLYRNEVYDPLSQQIEAVLALKPPYQQPRIIFNLPGYRVEESQGIDLRGKEETLLLISFRGLGQSKPLHLQLYHVKKTLPFATQIKIPELSLPLYEGTADLDMNAHTAILKLKRAIVSPYFAPPFVYEILSFGFWDDSLNLNSVTYSKPKKYPQFFNLAKHFLQRQEFKKTILLSLRGLELLKTDPLLIPDEIRAQVRLNLAKAYSGIQDYRRSKIILSSIEKDLPKTSSSPEAKKLLLALKRGNP
jgi:hypothetical protein